jgi:hypothetical protein
VEVPAGLNFLVDVVRDDDDSPRRDLVEQIEMAGPGQVRVNGLFGLEVGVTDTRS